MQQPEESNSDSLSPSKILILQPGSCNIRLGRASDPLPRSVPHVIAYRCSHQVRIYEPDDTCVLHQYSQIDKKQKREEALTEMSQYIKLRRQALGLQRTTVPPMQYIEFNSSFEPATSQLSSEIEWSNVKDDPKFVIGDKALYVPPGSNYQVYKPMKHGQLNVGPHQSLQRLMDILEDLWSQAIYEMLEITKEDFKNHHVILLVPDITVRLHLKELMNLLLIRMGFSSALLHQESVCAAFGAGLSSACVVDIGDEKTNICCVEDGISNPSTRLTLHVGGSDITRLFYDLLLECKFPYRDCKREDRLDGLLIEELKETWCHADLTMYGVKVNDFQVIRPDRPTMTYTVKLADQVLYPPLALLYPEAFQLPDEPLIMWQDSQEPDSEDHLDESYWLETSQSKPSKGGQEKEKSMDTQNTLEFEEKPNQTISEKMKTWPIGSVPTLTEAIHRSIDCSSSAEMRKKLYGSILVIGGGYAFQSVATVLQAQLYIELPAIFQKPVDAIEVSSNPRDMDPTFVAWKGAAVLSYLDTTQEMWINQEEWVVSGVRLLRERVAFCW